MEKTTYSREELERQLSESRREFWAADATINNLELKLAEIAEQLANAEKRIAELESLTAPQLPQKALVVPDEMTPKQASRSYCGEVRGYRDGWNACRAAMLHGSEPETDNTNQQFESLSRDDK